MSSPSIYVVTFNCGRELCDAPRFAASLVDAWSSSASSVPSSSSPTAAASAAASASASANNNNNNNKKSQNKDQRDAKELGKGDQNAAPSILVLALQEIAPIAYSFLGGSFLAPYFVHFRRAVALAAQQTEPFDTTTYENVISRNVGMTAIMVFVRHDHVARVSRLEAAGVGVGVRDMGNKGAVAVRLAYDLGLGEGGREEETVDITLVSAHLAPMEDALERRNQDWRNIVRGLVFRPLTATASASASASTSTLAATVTREGSRAGDSNEETETLLSSGGHSTAASHRAEGIFSPTSHLFFAGDLNYRTSVATPLPHEFRVFPQPCEDDSYPQHYWHLLASDQLTQELRAKKTLQGLTEAPIDFPPTYKYSDRARQDAEHSQGDMDADGRYWDWAKHRWPSWCDRILYLDLPSWMKAKDSSAKIVVRGYTALPLMPSSDHRPVACSFVIPTKSIPEQPGQIDETATTDLVRKEPPFDIDIRWQSRRAAARREEVLVGLGAYLTLTWEGRGILLALICGALGGWSIIGSMI